MLVQLTLPLTLRFPPPAPTGCSEPEKFAAAPSFETMMVLLVGVASVSKDTADRNIERRPNVGVLARLRMKLSFRPIFRPVLTIRLSLRRSAR